jgi:hypothetical protein
LKERSKKSSAILARGILAPIIYMLLRVGILRPTTNATGGSSIANLNLIAIYVFAALTGLLSKVASDKLGLMSRSPEAFLH